MPRRRHRVAHRRAHYAEPCEFGGIVPKIFRSESVRDDDVVKKARDGFLRIAVEARWFARVNFYTTRRVGRHIGGCVVVRVCASLWLRNAFLLGRPFLLLLLFPGRSVLVRPVRAVRDVAEGHRVLRALLRAAEGLIDLVEGVVRRGLRGKPAANERRRKSGRGRRVLGRARNSTRPYVKSGCTWCGCVSSFMGTSVAIVDVEEVEVGRVRRVNDLCA